ncbi:hypothetical protein NMG60_11021187 [Bertholletia excelsa]
MGHHCCSKQKVKRGLWSPEEDEKLIRHITTHGHGCWSSVPKLAGLQRCGKSCRLRWINYLRPDLKRGSFTEQEERIIIDVHRILGNRWAQIAKHLPGRTDNEVKNFWNSCIKKKLIAQGLDPNTHNLLSARYATAITTNACKASHNDRQNNSSSVFSLTSSNDDAFVDIKTVPFVTFSSLPPSDQTKSTITNPPLVYTDNSTPTTTFEFQVPTTTFAPKLGNQNLNSLMEYSGQSSMEMATFSSSSLNPNGFGILDENLMLWESNNLEQLEPPKREAMHLPQQQQQLPQEKYPEGESDGVNIDSSSAQNVESSMIDCSNFDFDFYSALMPCGMYCNVSPVDQHAWNC